MTTDSTPLPTPKPTAASGDAPRSRLRRWGLLGVAAAAVATVGAAAFTHRPAFAHGSGFGGRGWHGSMDPEALSRRIDAMTGWVLADIDATPEQKDRVASVIKGAANDLRPLRELHMQARKESLQLLAAPTIDRARLEKLRLDQMQLGETASRRMLQAMMDAAEVLNPEQRAKLVERWQQRMARRRG